MYRALLPACKSFHLPLAYTWRCGRLFLLKRLRGINEESLSFIGVDTTSIDIDIPYMKI